MNVDPKDHAPVFAVARHQSTPAIPGGDSLPDWLQPFTEGLVDSVLSVFRQSGLSGMFLALLFDVDPQLGFPPHPMHILKTSMRGSKQNRKVERGPATQ